MVVVNMHRISVLSLCINWHILDIFVDAVI
jgi:hypothetical protein